MVSLPSHTIEIRNRYPASSARQKRETHSLIFRRSVLALGSTSLPYRRAVILLASTRDLLRLEVLAAARA